MLRQLAIPQDADLDAVGPAAVAVSLGGVGLHAGILYRHPDSVHPGAIHLAFHHDLRVEDRASEKWRWIATDLDPLDLEQVAALCRLIAKNPANKTIPYAFQSADTGIEDDGAVLVGTSGHGLTCATFVLAIFRAVNIELLLLNTWETRPEDVEAQRVLLDFLAGRDRAHAEAVERRGGCMRYRVEEVAAATATRRPVGFKRAEALGAALLAAFQAAESADLVP